MDKIELVVTHHMGGPVDRVWSALFGMAGGTIGRAGQNKLVLPDADAEVARVHAMVRLDSDQAYIANLCERRSVLVSGLEVLSGQEVPLLPGAEIGIGPYQLRALLPGAPRSEAPARSDSLPGTVASSLTSQAAASAAAHSRVGPIEAPPLNLASLPNPWADIPAIVGGESYLPELAHLHSTDQPPTSANAHSDNPFAMLGRVETAETVIPAQDQIADPGRRDSPPMAVTQTKPEPPLAFASTPLEAQGPIGNLPRSETNAHRAMVIPDDFDPFAADPSTLPHSNDAWSGDLAAKSLAEVVQLKNDALLQSLPKTSQFAGEMDNAAHAGLPKNLDPGVELNPLKLFREPGESMYGEVEDHSLSGRSDLAQIFSMPREARNGARPDMAVAKSDPAPSESNASDTAVAAGLLPAQGLDLTLFGAAESGSSADLELLDTCESKTEELTARDVHAGLTPDTGSPASARAEAAHTLPNQHTTAPAETLRGDADTPFDQSTDSSTDAVSHHTEDLVPARCAVEGLSDGSAMSRDMEALAVAFLEGAGIAPNRVNLSITPEFMHGFGEALRTAIQGSIDLLSARSEIKREFRADVTIIASGANNPLKFLPTADGVLLQLTNQTFPGFMKAVPAMKEAYKDLAVHQVALMAGIRAAYAEATSRLSPVELEKSAVAAGLLSKISTVHRKAALWDDYQQRYESIRRHAEDDLMAFSGKTFVQAYENAAQAAEGSL